MFGQGGAKVTGGDLPDEVIRKVDEVIKEFGECVKNEVQRRGIGPRHAIVRSMLTCDLILALDADHLWVIAQKKGGAMPSAHYFDRRQHAFPIEEIYTAATWSFGLDDPFVIAFPSNILELSPENRHATIQAIAQTHVESEIQRVNTAMHTIQINPIFGPASYQIDERLAFVLMPFAPELTNVYTSVIKPTIENGGFNLVCKRADDIKSNKAIIQNIWKSICEARLIIADLTRLNPNVMYELGIAHTLGKETILLHQRSQQEVKFPFDLTHIRRIEYEDTASGGQALGNELTETLTSILRPKLHTQMDAVQDTIHIP